MGWASFYSAPVAWFYSALTLAFPKSLVFGNFPRWGLAGKLPETPFLGQVHIWRANLCSSINFRVANNSPGTRKIGSPIGSIGGSVIWQQLTSVGIDRTLMETRTTILRVEESIPVRAGQLTLRAGVSSDPPTVRVALEST